MELFLPSDIKAGIFIGKLFAILLEIIEIVLGLEVKVFISSSSSSLPLSYSKSGFGTGSSMPSNSKRPSASIEVEIVAGLLFWRFGDILMG